MDTKPGFKTTEFWLTALTLIVGLLLASGGFESDGTVLKVLGVVAAALSSCGYSVSRGLVKKA